MNVKKIATTVIAVVALLIAVTGLTQLVRSFLASRRT